MNQEMHTQIEQEIGIFVRRITLLQKRFYKLDRSAYYILHHLASVGPTGVKTLAKAMDLDVSTISRQAAALDKKGYAKKKPHPHDGRSFYYQITAIGKEELEASRTLKSQHLKHVFTDWSDAECEQFGKLLQKYNQSV